MCHHDRDPDRCSCSSWILLVLPAVAAAADLVNQVLEFLVGRGII